MRLKNDKKLRDMFFVPDAMAHPAKAHIGMWQEIIERYTKPGDWILDPMAGIGTSLVACLMGRNVACVELEAHFLLPTVRPWAKIQQHGPQLGQQMGQALIFWGDARRIRTWVGWPYEQIALKYPSMVSLSGLKAIRRKYKLSLQGGALASDTLVDSVVTSPPYEGHTSANDEQRFAQSGRPFTEWKKREYDYSRPDSIITSPPYEGSVNSQKNGVDWAKQSDGRKKQEPHGVGAHPFGYTRPDAVISSPSYEEALGHAGEGNSIDEGKRLHSRMASNSYDHRQGDNIGNLKGEKYWESMRQVYQNCHEVLKSDGVMVLVLKGFTRDGKYIDLPEQTKDEVEKIGFKLFDRWQRELWNLSFWRILQLRRDPEGFDNRLRFEEILAFRKTEVPV